MPDDVDDMPGTILPRALFRELIAALRPQPIPGEAQALRALGDPAVNHNGAKQAVEISYAGHLQRFFVKKLAVGVGEAARYRAMLHAGAPVAALIASRMQGGHEVIVIEHLGRIGIEPGNAREFGEYLDALAQFQACATTDLPHDPQWIRHWLTHLQEVWQHTRDGAWGATLQSQACLLDGRWNGMRRMADELAAQLERLPRVPTHHDPAYGNVGRSAAGTPLVLFDLQYCSLHPWGRDLALALGGFAQAWPSTDGRGPWIERFCATYNRTAAQPVTVAQAETAVVLHLAAYRCWCDGFMLQAAESAVARDPVGFQLSWGTWLGRVWTQLHDWVERGTVP